MRNTGINIIGEAPWGTHFCQFYRDRHDLLDVLVPYFKAGLESNEACMWVTSSDLTTRQARAALRKAVPDVDDHIASGQLEILSYTEWYLKGGSFNLERVLNGWVERQDRALSRGFDGLRLSGDTVWLEKKDWADFTEYERAINETLGQYRIIALCTYSLKRCGAAEVLDVIRNHQFSLVRHGDKWGVLESSDSAHARAALRESEARLEQLASFPELNPNPVIEIDFETGALIYANDAARNLLPDLADRGLEHPWLAGITDIARQLGPSRKQPFERQVAIGQAYYQQSISLGARHNRVRIYGIDITEVKHAQEQVKATLESIGDGFFACDAQWRFIYINAAAERMLGIGQDAIGKVNWDVFPLTRGTELQRQYFRAAAGENVDFETYYEPWGRWYRNRCYPRKGGGVLIYFQDITEQKRAREVIRETEERLRIIGDNLPNSVVYQYTHDPDGKPRYLYMSAGIERLNGVTAEEVMADSWALHRQVEPAELAEIIKAEKESARTMSAFESEVRMRLPDGQERWMHMRSRPRRMADGRVVWDGVQTDITDRKNAEQAVRTSMERLYACLSSLYGSVLLVTNEGKIEFANQAFCDLYKLNVPPVDLVGRSQTDIIDMIRVMYADPDQAVARIREIVEGGTPVRSEEIKLRDGRASLRDFVPIFLDGKPYGRMWHQMEITDRKRAEEALRESEERVRLAIGAAELGTWDYNLQTGVLMWDARTKVLFGVPPDAEINYDLFLTRVHPEDRRQADEVIKRAISQGGAFETEYRTVDFTGGVARWIRATGRAYLNDAGQTYRFMGTVQDVTGHKVAGQEVEESRAKLQAALASMTDAVFISDTEGHFIDFNDAFAAFHHFGSKDECAKSHHAFKEILELTAPDGTMLPFDEWLVPRALRGDIQANDVYTVRRKDTGDTWIGSYSYGPIRDDRGAIIGAVITARDITDQKRAEEKVRQAQERLSLFIEHAPASLAMFDCQMRYISASRRWMKDLGLEGRTIEGVSHYDIFPDIPDRWRTLHQRSLAGEVLHADEDPFERADGSVQWLRWEMRPWYDAGRIAGIVIFTEDITSQKRAEKELLSNREYLRVVLSSIGDAVIATDLSGRITFFNPIAASLTGWESDEATGRPIHEIFRVIDELSGNPAEDIVERVMNEGVIIGLSNHSALVRRNGSRLPMEDSAAPIRDKDGNVAGVVVVFHDVTEKRRAQTALADSEKELRLVMDSVPALIGYVGPDMCYLRVNKGFEKMVGKTSDQIVGHHVREIVGEDAWPRVEKELERVYAGETVAAEHMLEYAVGKPWAQVFLMPDRDDAGRVQGHVVHIMDISERKRAEQDLAELQLRQAMILDSIADGFYSLDRQWRFIHANDAALGHFGLGREDIIGRTIWEVFPRIQGTLYEDGLRHAMETGEPNHFVQPSVVFADKIMEVNAYPGRDNLTVLFRDITEHMSRIADLKRLNRTLNALSHSDRAMMRATDEASYLDEVCKIVIEDCGHATVWVGFAQDDAGKTVRPVASQGLDAEYIQKLNVTWADTERGRGPTGLAIRSGESVICRNMLTDPRFEPWRGEATRRGFASCLSLPIRAEGRVFGSFTIYSREVDAFTDEEFGLLARLADDLSYGIAAIRTKAALEESEEVARQRAEEVEILMDVAPTAIFVAHDPECKLITGNREGNRFYECAEGDNVSLGPVGGPRQNVTRRFFRGGRELEPDELPIQQACRTGQSLVNCELDVLLPSGRMLYMLGNASPLFDEEGRVRGGIGTFVDITDRKLAEAELHANLARFELLADTAGKLLQSSRPQEILPSLCQRVMEHLDCQVFFNFLLDEKSSRLHMNAYAGIPADNALIDEWLDYGSTITGSVARDARQIVIEHVLQSTDPRTGRIKSFGVKAYACFPMLGPGGMVIGTLSFGTRNRETLSEADISLMKAITDQVTVALIRMQAERELRQSQAELVELNQNLEKRIAERTYELDRLNADLERRAHQLRALAQELTEAEERERRRLADILHDDLQQILVGAKLHLSLIPSHVPNPTSIAGLVTQVMTMIDETIAKSRGLSHDLAPPLLRQQGLIATLDWLCRQMKSKYGLEVDLRADLKAEISETLKVFLFRAAQEMLFNVVKHAATDKASIVIEQAGGHVCMIVSDSGKGFTVQEGVPSNWGTSGFGLFSIYERANLLSGRLTIDSAPGHGSRFSLEVPIEPGVEPARSDFRPAPAAVSMPELAPPPEMLDGEKPLRVLIVDDHQVLRQGLTAMLSSQPDIAIAGEAEDGRQALDMVQSIQPDVVIMDVSMPIMDGIEATRLIKREWPNMRVIGLSMFEEEDLAQSMLEAGAESYVSKTLGLKELVDIIRATKVK